MKTEIEAKHTPTPWEVGADGWIQGPSEVDPVMSCKMIARVNRAYSLRPEQIEESAANATLIVCAVNVHEELLDAVKFARQKIGNRAVAWGAEILLKLDAVIAKAEGK